MSDVIVGLAFWAFVVIYIGTCVAGIAWGLYGLRRPPPGEGGGG